MRAYIYLMNQLFRFVVEKTFHDVMRVDAAACPCDDGQDDKRGYDWKKVHDAPRARAMIADNDEALSAPLVAASAFNASSGGHSVARRSCDRRPLEISRSAARSVSDFASGCARYASNVIGRRLAYLNGGFKPFRLDRRNDMWRGQREAKICARQSDAVRRECDGPPKQSREAPACPPGFCISATIAHAPA